MVICNRRRSIAAAVAAIPTFSSKAAATCTKQLASGTSYLMS